MSNKQLKQCICGIYVNDCEYHKEKIKIIPYPHNNPVFITPWMTFEQLKAFQNDQ
jgi:hypothetical protein